MKQHITIEQLKELSEKGRKKLNSWITGIEFDSRILKHSSLQLLSIGQMIEFLKEGNYKKELHNGFEKYIELARDIKEVPEVELCDALWETIKQILEK